MKFQFSLLAVAATLIFSVSAHAQLKAPRTTAPATPSAAAPASAPAKSEVAPAASSAAAVAAVAVDPEKLAAGKLAAAGWLVLLDRRDWGRAWESSSSVFRTSVPLPAWMDGIPKVRDAMGAFVDRQPAESAYKTSLAGRPDGEYVTVIFQSKFDKRQLQEVVTTVREADGRWRVTGYSPQ